MQVFVYELLRIPLPRTPVNKMSAMRRASVDGIICTVAQRNRAQITERKAMILIAGGTGTLGTRVVRLLTARGLEVRILTRDPARAEHNRGDLVEIISGDVRDARAVERALDGAQTVISAVQGFAGNAPAGPQDVDRQGNSNLIEAARAGATEHFILLSIQGAAPDHPMDMFRMKYASEQELKASGLD